MFYSSGTTGRPKGVKPPQVGGPLGAGSSFSMLVQGLYGGGEDSVYLSPAPLYHAAPAGWTTAFHRLGATTVVMERFDPVEVLALIERHRVTHVQFVPTHLVRLLKLPAAERARFDLSSLRVVVHAAAPCPPAVKRAALDWLGPIVHEYYSGSEGVGFCAIGPEEWLAHPGSVGRSLLGAAHIVGAGGAELPPGEEGEVWFETPSRFEYHGDPAKTAAAFDERGWSTLGDIGRLDEDGYLYLTDRVSNMIITGGVNVYPREVEDVLVMHPAVADVAVIGVPHPDMGEAVRAVVQVAEAVPGDALAGELIAFCRERIAHFQCSGVRGVPRPAPPPAQRQAGQAPPACGRPPWTNGACRRSTTHPWRWSIFHNHLSQRPTLPPLTSPSLVPKTLSRPLTEFIPNPTSVPRALRSTPRQPRRLDYAPSHPPFPTPPLAPESRDRHLMFPTLPPPRRLSTSPLPVAIRAFNECSTTSGATPRGPIFTTPMVNPSLNIRLA